MALVLKRTLTAAQHADPRPRPAGYTLAEIEDTADVGTLMHGWRRPDGTFEVACVVAVSPARSAVLSALQTAAEATRAQLANNTARVDLLARRAARYARDPVANAADQLTARLQHELLARLALATAADDA